MLTVHDLSFRIHPAWFTPKERVWHGVIKPRALAHRSSTVIAVSQQTRQELKRFLQLPADRISVIHSGIDDIYRAAVPANKRNEVRQRYDLRNGYVLFIGAAEPRKNLSTLLSGYIKARAQGLRAELVIAGSPSRHLQTALHRCVEPVRVLGYVVEDDKPALYAEADTLALLSHHEGFGFPPLEALACGTPSLVSDYPVFTETLGDAAAQVGVDDAEGVARNLVHLENDAAYRKTLLKHGEPIVKRLTWARTAEATYEVLRTAAEDSHVR